MEKKLVFLALFIFLFTSAYTQNSHWEWGKSLYEEYILQYQDRTYTATDSKGNFYVLGMYKGQITQGPFSIKSYGSYTSIFVAKYDKDGNIKLLKSIGSKEGSSANGITIDKYDNIYICGAFSDSIVMDDKVIRGSYFSPLLFQLSADLKLKWAYENLSGLVGKVTVVNAIDSSLLIGIYCFKDYNSFAGSPISTSRNFIAKFSNTGTPLWVSSLEGVASSCVINNLISDGGNGLLLSLQLGEGSVFMSDTINANVERYTNYLVNFDSANSILWYKKIEGTQYTGINDIVCSNQSIYIAGTFLDSLRYGSNLYISENSFKPYPYSFFSLKFSKDGNIMSTWFGDGIGDSYASGLCKDSLNNVYVSGAYIGAIKIKGFVDSTEMLTGFICKLKDNITDTDFIYSTKKEPCSFGDISSNINNELFIYGLSQGVEPITFGTDVIQSQPINNSAHFVAKHSSLYLNTKQFRTPSVSLIKCLPNPVSNTSRTMFSISSSSPITITLHDILGREVLRREMGVQSEGEHEESLDVSQLPIGSYIVKISTNQEVFTSRISVVR